jgi:hypothetical protein
MYPTSQKEQFLVIYEFKSGQPHSDEEWRKQLLSGKAPTRPTWLKDIMVETISLESKPKELSMKIG